MSSDPAGDGTLLRTCANCACVWKIEKPTLQPPGMTREQFDALPSEQWVCRLNPPYVDPLARRAVQSPTYPGLVCWQWRPEKTLPGERYPLGDSRNHLL